jgi:hypothetical protein
MASGRARAHRKLLGEPGTEPEPPTGHATVTQIWWFGAQSSTCDSTAEYGSLLEIGLFRSEAQRSLELEGD